MISQKVELTTDTNKLLILGSGSTARKELLLSVSLEPNEVIIPDINESQMLNESPQNYVTRMAKEKAVSIACDARSFLVTADTIVTAGRCVLSKTYDGSIAYHHLRKLSGRRHRVFTAFCVKYKGSLNLNLVKTSLKMRLLNEKEIRKYIASREWEGCAGAYRIQGSAKSFFPHISGCFSNVIGLPIPKLINVLTGLGFFQNQQ